MIALVVDTLPVRCNAQVRAARVNIGVRWWTFTRVATACTVCGTASCDDSADLCPGCAGLLQWVRGYSTHIPGLPEKIMPRTRFTEDLKLHFSVPQAAG